MKKVCHVLAVCGLFLVTGGVALAQEDGAPQNSSVAVLNIEKVERSSVAWESLKQQIDGRRAVLQEEVRTLQSQLEQQAKELETQRTILAPEAFSAKVSDFQKERARLQQETNRRKQQLDRAYVEARRQIRKALDEVLLEIIKEYKIALVLSAGGQSSAVYYAKPDLWIDKLVLGRLDKTIQSVTLSEETGESQTSAGE